MEVTNITYNFTTLTQNPALERHSSEFEEKKPIEKAIDKNFDTSEALMSVEEVEDYLFMIMGLPSPGKSNDIEKGARINLIA